MLYVSFTALCITRAEHESKLDWCFLSPELRFLYLDPVFTTHLEEQAPALLGRSLLEFLHPDEVESAQVDLGNVVRSRILHGSVTRCVVVLLYTLFISFLMSVLYYYPA